MVISVHLCAPGKGGAARAYRSAPDPDRVQGLTYAETVIPAPLGPSPLPSPGLSEVGLIAAWESDEAVDSFLREPGTAGPFAAGWHVRTRPLRVVGSWSAIPSPVSEPTATADDEPVAVLTLGRPRKLRVLPFLRTSAAAEAELEDRPGLLRATGLAHPPSLISTFSLWRSAAEMRKYAGASDGAHVEAVRRDRVRPFHHESAFIRLRPYQSAGTWGAEDPLAGLLA